MIGKYFKIGAAAVAVIAVIGLVMFISRLQSQINSRDDDIRLLKSENTYLAWEKSIRKAEADTVWGIGAYMETADSSITDTLYLEPGHVGPVYIPRISGFIKINTTKSIYWGSDSLNLRVKGRAYYPAKDSLKSWLLIYPVSGMPPERPVARRSPPKWGIGLVYIRSVNVATGNDYFGASVRWKRLNLAVAYDPWQRGATGMIGVRVLGF